MSKHLFTEFVDLVYDGNQSKAAEALGVDRSLINRICAGDRAVTPAIAEKAETLSAGRFKKERFIWPEAPTQQGEAVLQKAS